MQPKFLIAMGGLSACTCFLIAINMPTYWWFWAFYCLGWGLNTGWCYLVTLHHSWLWFPDSPGLASGICAAGYGLAALVFDNIMTPIINPDNIRFESPCFEGVNYGCYPDNPSDPTFISVNQNFKKMMYILISIFAVLDLVGILTVW